ncbi:MAG: AEC family transporter [Devosiaceae bacterium]
MSASIVGSALIPVILVIALAFLIRRIGLVNDTHVAGVERVTYVVFFPTLLFSNLSTASFDDPSVWTLALLLAGTHLLMGAVTWVFYTRSSLDGPSVTSAFQGANRFNSYIVLALAFAVYGTQGVQQITVPMALMIITINILCVSILARYGVPEEGTQMPSLWKALATNPLILASAAGLAVNPLQIDWPGPVDTAFGWFGTAAIAMGLFAVGAGLRPISGKGSVFAIGTSSVIKLIGIPALFLGLATLIGLPRDLMALGLIATIVPGATSSYILARQLGGNALLMAQSVTVGTVLSGVTVTIWFIIWPYLA